MSKEFIIEVSLGMIKHEYNHEIIKYLKRIVKENFISIINRFDQLTYYILEKQQACDSAATF